MDIPVGCIYVATNKTNGKQYVGRALHGLQIRKKAHENASRRGSPYLFHNALRKYGFDDFIWSVLEDNVPSSKLNDRERHWIAALGTYETGYNLNRGGGSQQGFIHSDATKRRIRDAAKKRTGSNAPMYGKRASKETRRKLSDIARLRKNDRAGFFGKRHTDESKEKIRRYQLEHSKTKGVSPSLESRRKMSDSAIRRWSRKQEVTQDESKLLG